MSKHEKEKRELSFNAIANVENLINSIDNSSSYLPAIIDSECVKHKLVEYVEMLLDWQKIHNIVSGKYDENDVWENIFDSLILLLIKNNSLTENFSNQKNIIDAGAGGGFPGIPLAIIFPQLMFHLVDSDRKKCSFLRMVKAKIDLQNVIVINKDITKMDPVMFIITKAAFSPSRIGILANVVLRGGNILIWGKHAEDFANTFAPLGITLTYQYDYSLPNGKERCLLSFEKG